MRKILLLAGIAIFSLTATAQEKESKGLQGTWWVGGQVSFDSSKTGDAKSSSNMILPIVGTFIAPSVTVGLGIGVISSKTDDALGVTTSDASTFVVKPLIRKYWNVTGGLFFYGQAALPVMSGKEKVSDSKTFSFDCAYISPSRLNVTPPLVPCILQVPVNVIVGNFLVLSYIGLPFSSLPIYCALCVTL